MWHLFVKNKIVQKTCCCCVCVCLCICGFQLKGKTSKMSTVLQTFAFRAINLNKLPGWEPGLPPSVRGQDSLSLLHAHTHTLLHLHTIHIFSARPNQINTSVFTQTGSDCNTFGQQINQIPWPVKSRLLWQPNKRAVLQYTASPKSQSFKEQNVKYSKPDSLWTGITAGYKGNRALKISYDQGSWNTLRNQTNMQISKTLVFP